MKKYLLLRDNRETGPHSFEQLGSIGLLPTDLVWIEDESTSWNYPGEIEELKNLIRHELPLNKSRWRLNKNEKIFISLPPNLNPKRKPELNDESSFLQVKEPEPVLETNYVKPFEELKENYRTLNQKKNIWDKKIFLSSQTVSVAAIFMGVVLGAFVIKKMVDGYVPASNDETVTATPIIDREVEPQPDENIKNALVTEIVPVYKAPVSTPKKINLKKQLRLSTNNYKVGLFGGINGLQLTVFNLSPQIVDKVIVAVDYLRPNGAVVQSENVSFSIIKPKSAQTISIPGSNRGVKVKYKILKVFAHNYKTDLKEV
jgi:hypothetical protein